MLDPSSPECQIVDTFDTPSETQSCPAGTQGTPPECSPVQPGNEPAGLASTDPTAFREGEEEEGEEGEEGTDELARELEETDREDSESDSESDEEGGEDGRGDGGGEESE